jgi:kumamolisin
MSPKELKEKFSAREDDTDKVEKCLNKFGLNVEKTFLETRIMHVSGTAKAMEAAFKPQWEMMRSPTYGLYRGRKGKIQIPKELEGIVTGVFGLDERRMAHRRSGAAVSVGPGTALKPLSPKKIEEHYKFPVGKGEGQSIAVAEFGGGYFAADMKKYCKKFRRPMPKVKRIEVGRGRAYTFKQLLDISDPELRHRILDESFEVMMDVEIIGGLCPKADITVYFSTFDQDGWINLLNEIYYANPVPVALSISWGRAEDSIQWSDGAVDAINDLLYQFSKKDITVCAASGDDGARDEVYDGLPHVDFPASSPYVLGVGGTMLEKSGSTVKEVVWWEDPGPWGCATGHGISRKFQKRPVWQNVQVAKGKRVIKRGRLVPDVSALAGEPYYDLVFANFPWADGKTSASVAVWAALIARINAKLPHNQRQRFLTPLLYNIMSKRKTGGKASFRDIKSFPDSIVVNNKLHIPTPGFDLMTGWGVPHGKNLLKYLKQVIT